MMFFDKNGSFDKTSFFIYYLFKLFIYRPIYEIDRGISLICKYLSTYSVKHRLLASRTSKSSNTSVRCQK